MRTIKLLISAGSLLASTAFGEEPVSALVVDTTMIPAEVADAAVLLRERALLDNLSVDIVESLTTEVGPRRMGTEGDRRAIAWARAKFQELGFDRVWTEEVELDRGWIRGEASAEIVSPYPHNIVLTALGYSVGTAGDLVGEVVEFESFADLEAVPEGDSLAGKIAFVSYSMNDYVPKPGDSTMSAYREGGKARGRGHVTAAKRGAAAILIRSVGIDNNRYAHTGSGYGYVEGVRKIPAAAISPPDAVLIQNMLRRGGPVTLSMNLTSEITGPTKSANIIGEITGREVEQGYLVLGAHVDSWDEGTGALDDGAGVGSMMAAAALIGQMETRPPAECARAPVCGRGNWILRCERVLRASPGATRRASARRGGRQRRRESAYLDFGRRRTIASLRARDVQAGRTSGHRVERRQQLAGLVGHERARKSGHAGSEFHAKLERLHEVPPHAQRHLRQNHPGRHALLDRGVCDDVLPSRRDGSRF